MGTRKPLTDEERAARDNMLRDREQSALASLTDGDVFARFEHVVHNLPRKWSLNNALLLWSQAEEKGVALTDVRDFAGWLAVGRVPVGKGSGMTIWKPRFKVRTEAEIAKSKDGKPRKYIGSSPAAYWTLAQTAMSNDKAAAEKWASYQPPVITPGHADELIREARARLTEQAMQSIVDAASGEDDEEDDDAEPVIVIPAPRPEPEVTPQKRALAHLRGSGYTAKQYKGWDQAWRAWADDMRQMAIEQAEIDTRGKLFNERGWAQYKAGKLSTMMLFKGPIHTVQGFMSPELRAWFAEHGRPTGEDYCDMLLGQVRASSSAQSDVRFVA